AAATVALAQATVNRFVLRTSPKEEEPTAKGGEGAAKRGDEAGEEPGGSSGGPPGASSDGGGGGKEEEEEHEDLREEEDDDANLSYDGSDLVEWINSNGGRINPAARIGLDPSGSYRGVFLREESAGVKKGEEVARIPWDLIVKPKNYRENLYWSCEALKEIHDQFLLGDESKYAPYINYLKNQPRGRIVDDWSKEGKELLNAILGNDSFSRGADEMVTGLPPHYRHLSFEETWVRGCGGEDTELARAAFYQFTAREEDTLMVPFFDMHNHSNDLKYLNTIPEKPARPGEPFVMRAMRDIDPGEQISISYNRCHPCWHDETYHDCRSYSGYGTSDMFDVFGFVEDFPQVWKFPMMVANEEGVLELDTLKFHLERTDEETLSVTYGDNWSPAGDDEDPLESHVRFLVTQLGRLKELESTTKENEGLREKVPKHQWDMAWKYHEALMVALSSAILGSETAEEFYNQTDSDDVSESLGEEESEDEDGESADEDVRDEL
ncbi:hypothetical protein ACHAWF_002005, partial [Thalassiosira exigua]